MKKFTCAVLTLVLLFAVAMPVNAAEHAPQLESFEFAVEFSLSIDAPTIPSSFGVNSTSPVDISDISFGMTGAVVFGCTSLQAHAEVTLLGLGGMFENSPINIWIDSDFTDLKNPVLRTVVELPPVLRLMLAMENRNFARQFINIDISEHLAYELSNIEFPTPEEIDAMHDKVVTALNELKEYVDINEVKQFLARFINVLAFDLDINITDDNILSDLAMSFDVVLDPGGYDVSVGFDFMLELSNINGAYVEFPILTETNQFNVINYVME